MEIIVGMEQCIVDVSRSDFILMIGRQILVLIMILFVLFFGTMPISSPLTKLIPFFKETTQNNNANNGAENDEK